MQLEKEVIILRIALIMPGRGQIKLDEKKAGKPWLPPGSLLEVAGFTPPEHEIVIWDELAQGPLTEATLPEADFYGLSGLSTSRYGAYRVADLIRSMGKQVVAGGMDVTGHFSEGHGPELLEHYDAIVVGRLTSRLWRKVLDDFSTHCLEPVYQTDSTEPWEFALPRHHLINPDHYFLQAIRSSAGCKEACPFCTVHLVIGERKIVHVKPHNLLHQELDLVPKTKYLVVVDDSFGADYQSTMDYILPTLKETGRPWFTEITIKNLLGVEDGRKELIGPMFKAGCAGVYIGIESLKYRVSAKSLGLEPTELSIKKVHDVGGLVMGANIIDVNGQETVDDIKWTYDWIIKQKLEFEQLSLEALLPGSLSRQLALRQHQIIDNNPEHFDGAWPTKKHLLSPKVRIELLVDGLRQIYSTTNCIKRLMRPHVAPMWRVMIAGANYSIHQSIKNWEENTGYEHWLKTRIEIP